jgi:ubiquitin-protein ligase
MNSTRTRWYEYDPVRLVIEKKAMEERYPKFTLHKLDDDRLAWMGTLTSNSNTRYQIAVVYPHNFPNSPPEVYPIDPVIEVVDVCGKKYKHQFSDGHLCLYYPADRTFSSNSTVATVVTVAAAWFFSYEYWLRSGKREWPGIEAD